MRSTALDLAKDKYVAGLPRRLEELAREFDAVGKKGSPARSALANLKKRSHALYASAQAFGLDEVKRAMQDIQSALDDKNADAAALADTLRALSAEFGTPDAAPPKPSGPERMVAQGAPGLPSQLEDRATIKPDSVPILRDGSRSSEEKKRPDTIKGIADAPGEPARVTRKPQIKKQTADFSDDKPHSRATDPGVPQRSVPARGPKRSKRANIGKLSLKPALVSKDGGTLKEMLPQSPPTRRRGDMPAPPVLPGKKGVAESGVPPEPSPTDLKTKPKGASAKSGARARLSDPVISISPEPLALDEETLTDSGFSPRDQIAKATIVVVARSDIRDELEHHLAASELDFFGFDSFEAALAETSALAPDVMLIEHHIVADDMSARDEDALVTRARSQAGARELPVLILDGTPAGLDPSVIRAVKADGRIRLPLRDAAFEQIKAVIARKNRIEPTTGTQLAVSPAQVPELISDEVIKGLHFEAGLSGQVFPSAVLLAPTWAAAAKTRAIIKLSQREEDRSDQDETFVPDGPEGVYVVDEPFSGAYSAQSAQGRRVMLVTSEPTLLWYVGAALRALETEVVAVEDSQTALAMPFLHSYDLIIIDLEAPDLNGLEFSDRTRLGSLAQHVPVCQMAITADGLEQLRKQQENGERPDTDAFAQSLRRAIHCRLGRRIWLETQLDDPPVVDASDAAMDRMVEAPADGQERKVVRGRINDLGVLQVLASTLHRYPQFLLRLRSDDLSAELGVRDGALVSAKCVSGSLSTTRGNAALFRALNIANGRFFIELDDPGTDDTRAVEAGCALDKDALTVCVKSIDSLFQALACRPRDGSLGQDHAGARLHENEPFVWDHERFDAVIPVDHAKRELLAPLSDAASLREMRALWPAQESELYEMLSLLHRGGAILGLDLVAGAEGIDAGDAKRRDSISTADTLRHDTRSQDGAVLADSAATRKLRDDEAGARRKRTSTDLVDVEAEIRRESRPAGPSRLSWLTLLVLAAVGTGAFFGYDAYRKRQAERVAEAERRAAAEAAAMDKPDTNQRRVVTVGNAPFAPKIEEGLADPGKHAKPGQGLLIVESKKEGDPTRVMIDDVEIGQVPLSFGLDPGLHKIELIAERTRFLSIAIRADHTHTIEL